MSLGISAVLGVVNMLSSWPLLSVIIFLPLIGVLFLMLIRGDEQVVADNSRQVAFMGIQFCLSAVTISVMGV